ncbi:odorant receptor 30a-like [Amyelois transitella]|uniref:odorant receptor 30a-like n=1 Tax=Amyelois transitella TaxID=680683 RepID=UPI0029905314|nr:odorant receptor 30a-like [Amyelois transitella]
MKKNADLKFRNFHETFKYCAFGMAVANIYPNRNNIRIRGSIFLSIVIFCIFQIFWFLTYTVSCLMKLDIFNFARNVTLLVIVLLFFFKSIYAIKYTEYYASIIDTINNDYIKANNMDYEYQEIYTTYLKKSKTVEIIWLVIPIILSSQFPIYPAIVMIIENLTLAYPKKYMVHEMDMMFIEDIQYTSPFFEIYFAYNITQCIFLSAIFIGFDGSFCIATNHLCLKLKLMTHKVHRAFVDSKNERELKMKLREATLDHEETLQFFASLSDFFGMWLLILFLVASIGVTFNLFQIYILHEIHPKYAIFLLVSILHILLPCVYASNVTKVSNETARELYCVPWESCSNHSITKHLIFMIARSQQPMIFTGKGLVKYNMQLFISMMQSAYSFYTLITS